MRAVAPLCPQVCEAHSARAEFFAARTRLPSLCMVNIVFSEATCRPEAGPLPDGSPAEVVGALADRFSVGGG
ncbi:hypothetical protein GCM10020229_55230 [Kitasatospora albolonga]